MTTCGLNQTLVVKMSDTSPLVKRVRTPPLAHAPWSGLARDRTRHGAGFCPMRTAACAEALEADIACSPACLSTAGVRAGMAVVKMSVTSFVHEGPQGWAQQHRSFPVNP